VRCVRAAHRLLQAAAGDVPAHAKGYGEVRAGGGSGLIVVPFWGFQNGSSFCLFYNCFFICAFDFSHVITDLL
jgi:hypothetical protein